MATDNLELRLAHTTLDISGSSVTLTETWQAWQPALDVVLNEFTKTIRSPIDSGFDSASAKLHLEIQSWFVTVQAWHQSRAAIDNHSLFDASHILERWMFTPNGTNFDLSHPVCGTFDNQSVITDEGRPTLLGRVDAILNLVPGPTTWAQADSPSAEVLRVKCQPVAGADHYNVYNDLGGSTFELLGAVPDAGINTLPVVGGSYRVRMAAVTGGSTVGILSNAVSVTVNAVAITEMADLAPGDDDDLGSIETGIALEEEVAEDALEPEPESEDEPESEPEPEPVSAEPGIPAVFNIPLCSAWTWRLLQKLRRKNADG